MTERSPSDARKGDRRDRAARIPTLSSASETSPQAVAQRAPLTLRARLVLVSVAISAMATLILGLGTVAVLNEYLMQRADQQVMETVGSVRAQLQPDGAAVSDGGVLVPSGTLSGRLIPHLGQVNATIVNAQGDEVALNADQSTALLAAITNPNQMETVVIDGFGSYRVVAQGSGASWILIGRSLEDTLAVSRQLLSVAGLMTIVVISAVGLVAYAAVRRETRPLIGVQQTAARVAQLPLDRADVDLTIRVPPRAADPRTEVGAVGAALNRMLDHIQESMEERRRSEDKVRRFVADASHELRTPLASIRGYSELARRHRLELPEEVRYSLERINSESQRMTELVEELLLLARLDSGREFDREPIELAGVLIDSVSDAHVRSSSHTFSLDLPNESVVVNADRARVYQMVTNLITNARIHTADGTQVVVRLNRDAKSDDGAPLMARIEVEDNGQGIPPEVLPTLFERFARADASRTRTERSGSTGLGLAIVRGLAEQFGGTVEVESVPGRTLFRILLPLALDSAGVPLVGSEVDDWDADEVSPGDIDGYGTGSIAIIATTHDESQATPPEAPKAPPSS